jgi:hypothetical protein
VSTGPAFYDEVGRDYTAYRREDPRIAARIHAALGDYWRRPEAYLDPAARRAISVFNRLDPAEVQRGVERLRRHLEDGTWHERHGHLLDLDELDCGYRLVVADLEG